MSDTAPLLHGSAAFTSSPTTSIPPSALGDAGKGPQPIHFQKGYLPYDFPPPSVIAEDVPTYFVGENYKPPQGWRERIQYDSDGKPFCRDCKLFHYPRRYIICADGTWERPDGTVGDDQTRATPSNIAKIALMSHQGLVSERPDKAQYNVSGGKDGKEHPQFREQIVFYRNGVGATGDSWLAFISGATGRGKFGLDDQLKDCYRFLCENYCSATCDEIFLFGFSRGAYCVRSLAAWIYNCGILRREYINKLEDSFALFRRTDFKSRPGLLESQLFIKTWSHHFPDRQGITYLDWAQSELRKSRGFNDSFARTASSEVGAGLVVLAPPVHFLGVFDTVGAIATLSLFNRIGSYVSTAWKFLTDPASFTLEAPGPKAEKYSHPSGNLRDKELKNGIQPSPFNGRLEDTRRESFNDLELAYNTIHARHALALTERRSTFEPSVWQLDSTRQKEFRDVLGLTCKQVWFMGNHGDIGGGWVNEGLSDIPLRWMLTEAQGFGLKLSIKGETPA
ncbi:hypothetical protein M427DRAFT_39659 [Gonapodya prolifera JEL478]|uniref:T6SS Phospholipase effector Tle1-like catalytic domain-containing protein n=1 Tax=Gonapodya prolifera (strain JEL478) TaxID=1344416 RepID=A0A138ZX21_GONPJ|nr:hypothetical protein M427DRAFT_39659 [Gonapodya prolifera JEL478]|eukprot:KXS09037.1 hypothetical protein M427DRAFT_39659 [Gonapodya prolifera JEL478]